MLYSQRRKNKGFTLIELVIVIVILGLLAMIASLAYSNMIEKTKVSLAKRHLRVLKGAVVLYQAEHNGNYPPVKTTDMTGIEGKHAEAVGIGEIQKYVEKNVFTEPAGYKYEYKSKGAGNYDLILTGPGVNPEDAFVHFRAE